MIYSGGYRLRGDSPEDYYEQFVLGPEADSDGDGIPNIYETQGMRSYTGRILTGDPFLADTNDDGVDDWESVKLMKYNKQYPFFRDLYNNLPIANGQHVFDAEYNLNEIDPDGGGLYMNMVREIRDSNGNVVSSLPADKDSNNKNAPKGLLNHHVDTVEIGSGIAHQTTNECYSIDLFKNVDPNGSLWDQMCAVYINTGKSVLTSFGSITLQFYKDELGIAFHSRFKQPQRGFGFANIYDFFFGIGTLGNMRRNKSIPFTDNGDKYLLWAWRGDYLNLGTGGEVGFYYVPHDNLSYDFLVKTSPAVLRILNKYLCDTQGETEEWWMVAPFELDMDLSVYRIDNKGNIDSLSNWFPNETQWWITAFNHHEWDVKVEETWMVATIDFKRVTSQKEYSNVGKKLFDAFSRAYDSWNAPEKKYWYVDEDSMCVYIVWGEKYE